MIIAAIYKAISLLFHELKLFQKNLKQTGEALRPPAASAPAGSGRATTPRGSQT